jgi:glycosyltransferase involved in cell wall biosynthesis
MADRFPLVSVIIPCRNEVHAIGPCLESVLAGDYPGDRIEILVVDGMSDDGTRPVIESIASRDSRVRILDNPKIIQATAINIGIAHSTGSVIARMDAHCEYPANYLTSLVGWLQNMDVDNVGGACESCPSGDTIIARAIALAMSHPLGVGNAYFRLGTKKERWVDTVPFGCYRREIFEKVGLFDEEMTKDEDEELNYRIICAGGRILLAPDVTVRYYVRNSCRKLWRTYFDYGYFKPLVIRKIGRIMTFRQIIPPTFVMSLILCGIAAIWSDLALAVLAGMLGAYVLAIAGVALTSIRKVGLFCSLALFAAFPTMHFSYGLGFLIGCVDFLLLRRKGIQNTPPISNPL